MKQSLFLSRSETQDEQTAQYGEPRAAETHTWQNKRECEMTIIASVYPSHIHSHQLEKCFIFLMPVLQAQKWTSDILFKQPKSTLAKSSSRLSFVNRFRGKKHKLQSSSSKILQDTSNTRETPQNKVCECNNLRTQNRLSLCVLLIHKCLRWGFVPGIWPFRMAVKIF